MLGGGLKSPIYKEIRENNGLVYYFHCYQREITNNSMISILETETSNKNVDKVQDLVNKIISNPDKYLTKTRFEITKKYYKNKFEKENILIHNNGYKFFEPPQFSIEKIIKTLTYEDVRRVYDKYFDFSKFYQSTDKNEFNGL
jgi:predicted Zn-dependent peptidase